MLEVPIADMFKVRTATACNLLPVNTNISRMFPVLSNRFRRQSTCYFGAVTSNLFAPCAYESIHLLLLLELNLGLRYKDRQSIRD